MEAIDMTDDPQPVLGLVATAEAEVIKAETEETP